MCFFYCFLDGLFARFWQSWVSQGDPFWSQFSQILQILHEKKCAEIEARKLMTFGGLLGGAGGSGEACLSLQILQSMVSGSNHSLLPLRGCGESYGLRPLPPAPDHCSLLQDCRFLALLQEDLSIFGTQTCHLA